MQGRCKAIGCRNPIKISDKIRYCSVQCRRRENRYRKLGKKRVNNDPLSRLTAKGAAGELLVCADLLRKGYSVYRSVSPCGPCDLIAIRRRRDDRLPRPLFVEVTIGKLKENGTWVYSKHDKTRYNVLALYSPEHDRIFYFNRKDELIAKLNS